MDNKCIVEMKHLCGTHFRAASIFRLTRDVAEVDAALDPPLEQLVPRRLRVAGRQRALDVLGALGILLHLMTKLSVGGTKGGKISQPRT